MNDRLTTGSLLEVAQQISTQKLAAKKRIIKIKEKKTQYIYSVIIQNKHCEL